MVLVDDICQHLDDNNIGVFDLVGTSGNIFVSALPTTPNACIAVYDTGGRSSDLPQDHERTIQVIVRDVQYALANSRAWAIFNLLRGTLVIGNRKIIIRPVDAPKGIGRDNNKRYEFTINFVMWTSGD